jgi:HK97 family phage portal protein
VGIFDRFRNRIVSVSKYQMVTEHGEGFYSWNGNLYKSDIVRAAIRPKARAMGKIVGKHIRETIKTDGTKDTKINPDVYIRFLLEEPNPYMTGQILQEKLAVQLELNNNAFAYIKRDENGFAMEIYPITAVSCEAIKDDQGELFIRFIIKDGRTVTFRYTDIIHLRKDFNRNEIFGDSPADTLIELMEIVTVSDQGIVKAIKNSNVIRWLLKFHGQLRPEDIKKQTKEFVDSFLNSETSESTGAAATDSKFDAQQVTPNDYVPNAAQTDRTVKRIYAFFNTNEKIVQGNYAEDEWISYYESAIEPDVAQLSGEYTRKLFSRRERGFGNRIMFESSNLSYASMSTKITLYKEVVQNGGMLINEWREIMNWGPIEGGDKPIRRLDIAQVTGTTQKGSD